MKYLHYFEKKPADPPIFKFEIGDIVRFDNGLLFKQSPHLWRVIDRNEYLKYGKRKNAKRDKLGYIIADKRVNIYTLSLIGENPRKIYPEIDKKEHEIKKATELEIDTIKYNL